MSKSLKEKIKSNGWSFLALAGQWGLAFVVFIFLLRVLSKEDLGQWILYMGIITLVEVLRNGFTQNGFLYFIKQGKYPKEKLNGAVLIISAWMCLGSYIFIMGLSPVLETLLDSPLLIQLLWPSFIYYTLVTLIRTVELNWIATGKFKQMAISRTAYGVLFLGLVVAMHFTIGLNLIWLPFLQIAAALACVIVFVFRKKYSQIDFKAKEEHKELVDYGRYAAGTNLVSIVLNKSDIFIIGSFIGPGAVSIYNMASKLINIMEIPMTSISLYYYPQISSSYQSGKVSRSSWELGQGLFLSIVCLLPMVLGIFLFGDKIILLLAGEEYLESLIILKILAGFIMIKALGRFGGITLDAIGSPKFNFYILLVSLVSNILLNLLLINIWGITGIAIATIMTWILGSTMSSVHLLKSEINIIKSTYNQIKNVHKIFRNLKTT